MHHQLHACKSNASYTIKQPSIGAFNTGSEAKRAIDRSELSSSHCSYVLGVHSHRVLVDAVEPGAARRAAHAADGAPHRAVALEA